MTADRRITRASWRAHVHLNQISGGRRVYNGRVTLRYAEKEITRE